MSTFNTFCVDATVRTPSEAGCSSSTSQAAADCFHFQHVLNDDNIKAVGVLSSLATSIAKKNFTRNAETISACSSSCDCQNN